MADNEAIDQLLSEAELAERAWFEWMEFIRNDEDQGGLNAAPIFLATSNAIEQFERKDFVGRRSVGSARHRFNRARAARRCLPAPPG